MDRAFAQAAKVVESTFSAPYLAHNTMEPMNFFAHVTPEKAELLGPIQTPEYLENTLVSVLGMPKEKIDVMMTRMGGGFGRRLDEYGPGFCDFWDDPTGNNPETDFQVPVGLLPFLGPPCPTY